MGARVYEDTDGYCIVSGERLHSEIPRLFLVNSDLVATM